MSVGAVSQVSPGPGRGTSVRLPSSAGLRWVRHGHPPCRSAVLFTLGVRALGVLLWLASLIAQLLLAASVNLGIWGIGGGFLPALSGLVQCHAGAHLRGR